MADSFINWQSNTNEILLNPRWPNDVVKDLTDAAQKWLKDNSKVAQIILSTSGTTAKSLKESKLVVLSKAAFLNSAKCIGQELSFSSHDRIAQTLPRFHVGGLSQEARSFVWGQKVFQFDGKWDAQNFFSFLGRHEITHTSLVPTQVYDLVFLNQKAPASLKLVFVGGGILGPELENRAQELGYPVCKTYGMTETAAMVARQNKPFSSEYSCFPHAKVRLSPQGLLQVHSTSLFEGYLKMGDKCELDTNAIQEGWFLTEDLGQIMSEGFKVLGRSHEYAKISGEGVYLPRLQQILQDIGLQNGWPHLQNAALQFEPDQRLGSVVHIFSELPIEKVRNVIEEFNKKVLPFERIRGFHQIKELPVSEMGKIRWQNLEKTPVIKI